MYITLQPSSSPYTTTYITLYMGIVVDGVVVATAGGSDGWRVWGIVIWCVCMCGNSWVVGGDGQRAKTSGMVIVSASNARAWDSFDLCATRWDGK
jgi:hypothetical protein